MRVGGVVFEHCGGGLVVVHSERGQQELRLTGDEVGSIESEAERNEEAIAAMRVCIVYARDRRGNAFDFDTWIRLVEHALEKGKLPPHAIEEAQAEALTYRNALTKVRSERDQLQREVEELRRRQAAYAETSSHG